MSPRARGWIRWLGISTRPRSTWTRRRTSMSVWMGRIYGSARRKIGSCLDGPCTMRSWRPPRSPLLNPKFLTLPVRDSLFQNERRFFPRFPVENHYFLHIYFRADLIDWLLAWLIYRSIDWLSDWSALRLFDRSIDWLIDWLRIAVFDWIIRSDNKMVTHFSTETFLVFSP